MQRFLSLITIGMLLILAVSCQSNESSPSGRANTTDGKSVFVKHCRLCHGADGQLGLNGAANLAESTLPKSERIQVISHGRKMMPPFQSVLSPGEIDSVASYVQTLRKKP